MYKIQSHPGHGKLFFLYMEKSQAWRCKTPFIHAHGKKKQADKQNFCSVIIITPVWYFITESCKIKKQAQIYQGV